MNGEPHNVPFFIVLFLAYEWSAFHDPIWSYSLPIGQIPLITFPSKSTNPRKSTDDVIRLYISNSFHRPASVLVVMSVELVTEQASPEESPTRYMLPEQVDEDGKGLVDHSNTDYSLNPYSPASYRFSKKKKRKSSAQNKEPKKKKAKTGKTVQFHSKVIIKTIHGKRKIDFTEIELSNEEEYDKRHSDFVVKRAHQKQWMKLHHQQRPMTPKRMNIQATIQRENGNA